MTTPFDKYVGKLIGSTKNCYILLDRYERCATHTGDPDAPLKELDKVAISFRFFTLFDTGFFELGIRPTVTDIFAIQTNGSNSEGHLMSIFQNPVYDFQELGINSPEEIQPLLNKYNFSQLDNAIIEEDKWNRKHKRYPYSDEITNMLKYFQRVIGQYEVWISEILDIYTSDNVRESPLRPPKRGEMKKLVLKFCLDRKLEKYQTIPGSTVLALLNDIKKYGVDTTYGIVRTNLYRLNYFDPYKKKS